MLLNFRSAKDFDKIYDCHLDDDDTDEDVYPGRKPESNDMYFDSNGNKIFGKKC